MNVWTYKYISPYLAAKRTTLLTREDLDELMEGNINLLVTKLMDTPYRKEINAIYTQRLDVLKLEDALITHFIDSVLDTVERAPKDIATYVNKYIEKFEVDALKDLIKVIYSDVSPNDAFKYILPAGRFSKARCEEIISVSNNLEDLIEQIVDTDYSYVLMDNKSIFEDTKLLFLLESSLDKYYYHELWKTAEKIGGLDGKIIQELTGLKITAMNMKVILRYISAEFHKESIPRYLVLIPEIMDVDIIHEAIQAKNIDEMLRILKARSKDLGYDYQYMFNDMVEEYKESHSISRLEYILDKSILNSSQLMMKRYTPYFNVASLMAYINSKMYEFRNVRAILHGVSTGLSSEQIKNELILD